jgi:transcriptional regulator with XRE-family HTH domain
MINIKQIKAARALLDWTQEDLAKKSGMSLATINKLERNIVSPRQFTLETLQETFERDGIEFTEGPGVRLTENIFNIKVFDGARAPLKLLEDRFETLLQHGGEYVMSGLDDRRWNDYRQDVLDHHNKLRDNGLSFRALVCEGDTMFLDGFDPLKHYRWMSKQLFTQMPYYVYGDKYAMLVWGPVIRVVIIQNKIVAETMRKQFELNWATAKEPAIKKAS